MVYTSLIECNQQPFMQRRLAIALMVSKRRVLKAVYQYKFDPCYREPLLGCSDHYGQTLEMICVPVYQGQICSPTFQQSGPPLWIWTPYSYRFFTLNHFMPLSFCTLAAVSHVLVYKQHILSTSNNHNYHTNKRHHQHQDTSKKHGQSIISGWWCFLQYLLPR